METTEIVHVQQAEMLQAINRAEVDIQIATAKQYPRDINKVLNTIATYATMDKETAEDCFYTLRRENKNGEPTVIEGLSVRMAEIIAGAWGNLRVQCRIIGNDGRQITAQAICHDLETNLAVSKEVKRSIVTKKGYTFSEDMQVVTGNAACSIAFRNAVLTVIPKAVTKKIINNVREVAMGTSIDLEQSRQNVIQYYGKINVTQKQLFAYLGIKSKDEMDKAMIFELRALANAIKEGTTSVQETFHSVASDSNTIAEEVKKKAEAKQDKISRAMQKAQPKEAAADDSVEQTVEVVDTETGEVIEPSVQETESGNKINNNK